MPLLEREHDLEVLTAAFEAAAGGRGRVALVSGEAGIGKTALVERFLAMLVGRANVLKGHCDPLFTPTPLGPLCDIARHVGGIVSSQLRDGAARGVLFSTLLDHLKDMSRPAVLVIEDLHWADEATLDLVKYLSRRVGQATILIVLTYRGDEVGMRPPLRMLLGDLASSGPAIRLELSRLSIEAVRELADASAFDPAVLHQRTAGNPFFVTEILAGGANGIPGTVRDAVLARAVMLGSTGRHALEAAAVIGSRIALQVLAEVLGPGMEGLVACIRGGMLEEGDSGLAFRHELAREAVLSDLDPVRRRELNRLALEASKRRGHGDVAQLTQYAEGAGDGDAVCAYGLEAARAAVAAGAHREAAAQYARVLLHAGQMEASERALLHEAYAEQCAIVDDLSHAIDARRQAIGLWRDAGNRLKEGENLAALAWPLVRSGRNAEAEEASGRSIDVLKAMAPTRELAIAYRVQAHLRMLDRDSTPAVRLGRKAIELGHHFGDDAVVAAAENVVGAAMLVTGDDKGRPHLDRSLALARAAGLDELVGLAYLNLGSSYGEQYRFEEAEKHLSEGITYTRERDLDHANHYMRAWLALTRLYQGRWDEAADLAGALTGQPHVAAISRIMALVALGRVRVRRGDPGGDAALDEALDLALQTDTLQRLAPVRAARAEAAWFAGDIGRMLAEARAAHDLALKHRHRWHVGEFLFWRHLGGERLAVPRLAAAPFGLQVRGDWARAAKIWKDLGCPFEQARALSAGDEAAQLAALEIFTALGADPAASSLRQRLRSDGVRRIPRGPRAATRRNPFGLTTREMEILGCLADGFSNGQIGARLHVSPKTVDHHVSSVLAKLSAASRGDAARIAREQGLLGRDREQGGAK